MRAGYVCLSISFLHPLNYPDPVIVQRSAVAWHTALTLTVCGIPRELKDLTLTRAGSVIVCRHTHTRRSFTIAGV